MPETKSAKRARLTACNTIEQKEQAIEIYALGIRGKGRDPGNFKTFTMM
jgi:hypothetical protein